MSDGLMSICVNTEGKRSIQDDRMNEIYLKDLLLSGFYCNSHDCGSQGIIEESRNYDGRVCTEV